MKNSLLFCFLFLFATLVYSQTTYTKKYNNLLERYEYFDNSNNLIGYQKYNTTMGVWEYTDLTTANNNAGRYIIHDYGTPTSNFNYTLAAQALAGKQARYQSNFKNAVAQAQALMDKLDAYSDLEKRENAKSFLYYRYKDYFDRISKYADFSSNYVMNQVYEQLSTMYNETVNKFNNQISKSISSTTVSKSNDESDFNSSLAHSYFNDGLNAEKTENFNLARTYYRIALDLDPSYTKATDNLCHIILKDEYEILQEIKSLKSSGENQQRLKELLAEKEKIYRDALLYFEKALIYSPNNEDFQSMATLIKKRLNE